MAPVDKPRPVTAAEWRRWRRDVFGDPYLVWHDGPDFAALLRAVRTDPATVHRMLAAGIDDQDPVAAESVTALADAGFAPPGRRSSYAPRSPAHRERFSSGSPLPCTT